MRMKNDAVTVESNAALITPLSAHVPGGKLLPYVTIEFPVALFVIGTNKARQQAYNRHPFLMESCLFHHRKNAQRDNRRQHPTEYGGQPTVLVFEADHSAVKNAVIMPQVPYGWALSQSAATLNMLSRPGSFSNIGVTLPGMRA